MFSDIASGEPFALMAFFPARDKKTIICNLSIIDLFKCGQKNVSTREKK